MPYFALVNIANWEADELVPLLRRGAKIPEDWPDEVVDDLVRTGGAGTLKEAVAAIEQSHQPAVDGTVDPKDPEKLRDQIIRDHDPDTGAEFAKKLSARWLAEIEVAVANGFGPPSAREQALAAKPVELDANVKIRKPKAKA